MNGIALNVLMLAAATATAVAIGVLPEEAAFGIVTALLLLAILLGWIVVLQSGGMRRSRGWREAAWHGPLVTVWANWRKPLPLSVAAQALWVAVAAGLGAIGRILWVVYA